MQKNWSDIAGEDYLSLQSNKKLLKRVNEILKDIVYKIQDGEMYIAYCGTHYHK